MKRIVAILLLLGATNTLFAQYVYTINADSVKITNHCDTAELIIENHTQSVPGFLFNKGRGRTEFRRGLFSIDDTTYLLGADTLNLGKALVGLGADNGILRNGNTFEFGNDINNPYGVASQVRPTFFNQNSSIFNWMGGYSGIFTLSKFQYSTTENNVLSPYYLARFYNPQAGLLVEGNVNPAFNGPLGWINFKNNDPASATQSFFGDPTVAGITLDAVKGADSKIYHSFFFTMANDTPTVANSTALRLLPTFSEGGYAIKIPTAATTRLSVEDNITGCAPCLATFNVSNPYSRLVVDAHNYPLVAGNLPSAPGGAHALVIDNDGKIWKGDSTVSQDPGWSLNGNANTIPGVNYIGTADYTPLSISANGTEAINIQPTGFVGINTNNPLTQLQIYKPGEDGQLAVTGDAPSMRLWGPTASYTSGTTYSAVLGLGTTIADYSADAVAGDLVMSNFMHNAIIFSTDYLNTRLAHQDEKMRIDGDGHVGINTHNPTAQLHVVDSVRFENLPAGGGNYLLIDGDGYLHVSSQSAVAAAAGVAGPLQAVKNNSTVAQPAISSNEAALQKKIEDLKVYLVEQEMKWQAQDQQVKKQAQELEALKQQVEELKKIMKGGSPSGGGSPSTGHIVNTQKQ